MRCPCRARTLALVLALTCLIALGPTAGTGAQDDETDRGITLTITPSQTYFGGAVTISGATAPDARRNNRMVTARFTPPQGEVFLRRFELADDMTYEFTLTPVTVAGEWTVKVQGPLAQLGTAEGAFVVSSPAAFAGASVRSLGQGMMDAAEFADDAHTMVADFTALPAALWVFFRDRP